MQTAIASFQFPIVNFCNFNSKNVVFRQGRTKQTAARQNERKMKMFVIIITNDSCDPHVLGTWETRKEAEQALQQKKDSMKEQDWKGVTEIMVTGIWKVN
tara:strand:- start:6675 stop:6974 length:300 start_codon:yes stop_codon:yes gene_type:complete